MRDVLFEISNIMNCSLCLGIISNYFIKKKKVNVFFRKIWFYALRMFYLKYDFKLCIMRNILDFSMLEMFFV